MLINFVLFHVKCPSHKYSFIVPSYHSFDTLITLSKRLQYIISQISFNLLHCNNINLPCIFYIIFDYLISCFTFSSHSTTNLMYISIWKRAFLKWNATSILPSLWKQIPCLRKTVIFYNPSSTQSRPHGPASPDWL